VITSGRHPGTVHIAQFFDYEHLSLAVAGFGAATVITLTNGV
jgi:hypothetical protein